MVDDLPTVWRAEPHTLAKHAILERYLQAWYPILSFQSQRVPGGAKEILFIDGFAGPGEYAEGQPGSPAIALEAALKHSARFPVPVRFLFIELRPDRFDHLTSVLTRYSAETAASPNVRLSQPRQGQCDAVLGQMLDEYEQKGIRFGPALAFLDQFGYSAVSMQLIARILGYPQCEVFSYLDYKDMNRFILDPSKAEGFNRTWGGDEWRQACKMRESDRRAHLLESYKKALRTRAKAKFVTSFAMFDRSGKLLYWLVFCTNNLRGLEEMKKAMWKVDGTGGFRFSDRDDRRQLRLLSEEFDQEWLAETLATELACKTMTAAQVEEYVLTTTPCYLFRRALEILETGRDPSIRIVQAPEGRRRGTFPKEMLPHITIEFHSRLF
jgi:three-Cys-motif partner protein